jgi:hypothetical protein
MHVIRRYLFWMKPRGIGSRVWWLSMLWAGIGAAASGFIFLSSTQPVIISNDGIPTWLGGAGSANAIWTAGVVAIAAWLVLTIPVLIAGRARLRAWELGHGLWAGAWVAGLALMVLTKVWADNLPQRITCGTDRCGVVPYYGPAVVNLRELAICAAFLAVGAVMTWILAGPEAIAQPRRNAAA